MNCIDLVNLIGGDLINPNESIQLNGVAKPDLAQPFDIVFLFDSKFDAKSIKASLIVSKKELDTNNIQIIHQNPRLAMAETLEYFRKQQTKPTPVIAKNVSIHSSVRIGSDVRIEDFVSIGSNTNLSNDVIIYSGAKIGKNCKIGLGSIIHSNVVLYDNCEIGDNSIIHANTTIGTDGFGYENHGGKWVKIQHISGVKIGDNVEIGSHTTVNRGCLSNTVIKNGVKIDDHVHIAHNCVIGENTIIAGGVLIGGSTELGTGCIVAGQACIAENLKINKNSIIFAKSGVTKNIDEHSKISGFPAQDHKEEVKFQSFLRRLFRTNN